MQCRLCAGTGRLVLLATLMADMRLRSSYRKETCHFCWGTGDSARSWPDWEEEQRRLRAAQRAAAADTGKSSPSPARSRRPPRAE